MLAICGNSCHELYKAFWYSFQKLLSPAKLNQNWLGFLGLPLSDSIPYPKWLPLQKIVILSAF